MEDKIGRFRRGILDWKSSGSSIEVAGKGGGGGGWGGLGGKWKANGEVSQKTLYKQENITFCEAVHVFYFIINGNRVRPNSIKKTVRKYYTRRIPFYK